MTPDRDLLRQYVLKRDEAAFAEIVRRHVNLVYAAALRQVNGETALAEDVTQATFAELVSKAPELCDCATLAGWLYATARFLALRGVRGEQRRRAREQEALAMSDQNTTAEISWEQLRPLLDEAVAQLDEPDRDAVLLRFFEEKTHREVGIILGLNENTARMRVERALEKLRSHFARAGVTTTAALLATTLGAHGATPAPAVFAASVAGKSLATASTGTSSAFAGVRALFAAEKNVALLVVSIAAVMLIVAFWPKQINQPSPNKTLAAAPVPSITPAMVSPTPLPPPPMNISQNLTRAATVAALVATAPMAPAQNPSPPMALPPVAPILAPAVIAPAADSAPVAPTELARDINQFALDLYKQYNFGPAENAFISPYSISTALSALLAGAQGQTAAQISQALHLSNLATSAVASSFGALQQALSKEESPDYAQLIIANSLWAEREPEHPILPEYIQALQNNFDSEIFPVDFQKHPDDAIAQINTWIDDKTNGKIQNLVRKGDVNEQTRLALVNAVYFKAAWLEPFDSYHDLNDVFHLADGSTKPLVLMHGMLESPRYLNATVPVPCQILELKYLTGINNEAHVLQEDFSFVVILPNSPTDLVALEKALNADQLASWLDRLSSYGSSAVEVFLPKFKLEQAYELAGAFKALGVADAFIPTTADFSGINGAHDLFLDAAIHQTYLNVNEAGTEAAAGTGLGGAAGVIPRAPPIFRADHPFLFLIRDNTTGSILFLGRLASPP